MSRFLRTVARRVSSILAYNPRLHAALKGAFLGLPEKIRGRQMIYDGLREFGISRRQDVTFCVVRANDGVTNDPLSPLAKQVLWKGGMGVELLPCPYVLGSRISAKTLGGTKQELPTNITYADNEERTTLLESLPPDDALSHSSSKA